LSTHPTLHVPCPLSLHAALPIFAPAVGGGSDPLGRRVEVDHGLAVQVPAALGVDLVLDVAAGEPCVLELLDRAGHVHRLAEAGRSEEHTSELQSRENLVCRLLLE